MSQRGISISTSAYARLKTASASRDVPMQRLVEQALVGEWSADGVRSTTEAIAEANHARGHARNRARQGGAQRFFAERDAEALAAMLSTHVSLEQRCSLDVSLAVMDLVDDRVTRLREIDGVEVSRAELFDRAVNAALDLEGAR